MRPLPLLHNLDLLNLFAAYLLLNVLIALVAAVLALRARRERTAALAAVALLGWLDAFALLGGFSIGWMVAVATALLGAVLFLLARHYRPQIALAAGSAALLALSLRGFAFAAFYGVYALLAAAAIVAGVIIVRRRHASGAEPFDLAALGLVASLAGLAFAAAAEFPAAGRWIAGGAVALGAAFALISRTQRGRIAAVALGSLLLTFLIL